MPRQRRSQLTGSLDCPSFGGQRTVVLTRCSCPHRLAPFGCEVLCNEAARHRRQGPPLRRLATVRCPPRYPGGSPISSRAHERKGAAFVVRRGRLGIEPSRPRARVKPFHRADVQQPASPSVGRRSCQTLSVMNDLVLRVVDEFPEPAFSALAREAFSDYQASELLTDVLNAEAAARAPEGPAAVHERALRIGAFRGDSLVGWTFARAEGANHLHMINSGVASGQRRQGVYSKLTQFVIEHAREQGYVAVHSRHAANNNAVIIAKLKLGFFVSGFEYSEVYGPLVRLSLLLGELRRTLHQARSSPIRRVEPT